MKKVKARTFGEYRGVSGSFIGWPHYNGAVFFNYHFLHDCVNASGVHMIAIELIGTSKTELADPTKGLILSIGNCVQLPADSDPKLNRSVAPFSRHHACTLYFMDDKYYASTLMDLGVEFRSMVTIDGVKRKAHVLHEIDILNPEAFESIMDKSPEAVLMRNMYAKEVDDKIKAAVDPQEIIPS